LNAKSTFEEVVTTASLTDTESRVLPTPTPLTTHGGAKVISIFNQKAGVGKTTTTINLGAALVELGRRVLLVDFDPQGGMTLGLGVRGNELPKEETIYYAIMDSSHNPEDIVLKTSLPGLDFLPANRELATAETVLGAEIGSQFFLKRVLAPLKEFYDVILIDCQPSLGLLTVNALTAADLLLVPLQCEYFALRGFTLLQDISSKIQERLNPDLSILGIVATMFERTAHSKEVLSRIYEAFPDQVFDTVISKTVRFNETTAAGEPITSYASSSNGAAAYRRLAREVIARGGSV